MLVFIFYFTFVVFVATEQNKVTVGSESSPDSYVDAYSKLHTVSIEDSAVAHRRESNNQDNEFQNRHRDKQFNAEYPSSSPSQGYYGPPKDMYGPPSFATQSYGHPHYNYGSLFHNYGSPADNYGPPAPNYGFPASNYGPPAPNYGPPAPVHGYPTLEPFYGIPYALSSIVDKIKYKLSIITILKIIFKLVLFKKFVGFVAITCLLLFIPWLKAEKHHPHDDDEIKLRAMVNTASGEHISSTAKYVLELINTFKERPTQSNSTALCAGPDCKSQWIMDTKFRSKSEGMRNNNLLY